MTGVVRVAVRSIAFGDGVGGMERAAALHVRLLVGAGEDVHLYVPATSLRGDPPAGVTVVDVPWPAWDVPRLRVTFGPAYRAWTRRLGRALARGRGTGEVWHLHGGAAGALRVGGVRRSEAATVVNPHGMEEFGRGGLVRLPRRVFLRPLVRQARHATAVVATDRALVDAVVTHIGVVRERVTVVPNVVDGDALRALAAGAPDPGRFTVVTVGRVVHNKGYDLLVGALQDPRVAARLPAGWGWQHFGSGPGADALAQQAGAAAVPLTIRGGRSDQDVQRALARAGLFVQPSRYEGSSLTTLEAMVHGRVVVATPVGGIPDKVQDGRTGFLAARPTSAALADALVRAMEAGPDVGAAARQVADERFAPATALAGYRGLYRVALERAALDRRAVDRGAADRGAADRRTTRRRSTGGPAGPVRQPVVEAWPARANAAYNPYQALLSAALERAGWSVREFSPVRSPLRGADVWHWHWPDSHFAHGTAPRAWAAAAALSALLVVARVRRIPVVWTVHNLSNHEGRNLRPERWFLARLRRQVAGVHFLTTAGQDEAIARYPELRDAAQLVVPHGHYRDVVHPADPVGARRALGLPPDAVVLAFVGTISHYKGVDALVAAFTAAGGPGERLVVAGSLEPGAPTDLADVARRDPRLVLRPGRQSDAELARVVAAADRVVLPYRTVWNSGSALLALSLGRAVVVPDHPAFAELAKSVGEQWVDLYEPPLDAATVDDLLARAATAPAGSPDLQGHDWDVIAERTVEWYVQAGRHR
jgi:glycosyltransferase involved in cell wall biosynthesis